MISKQAFAGTLVAQQCFKIENLCVDFGWGNTVCQFD